MKPRIQSLDWEKKGWRTNSISAFFTNSVRLGSRKAFSICALCSVDMSLRACEHVKHVRSEQVLM